MDQKLELLHRVPLFARLGSRELEEVGRLTDEIDVPPGQVLTTEGRSGDEFFVIISGDVKVERGGRTIRHLGAGDFLGEIALVDGGPRTATATAEGPARLLVVGHREFHSLLDGFPTIKTAVLECLADRVRRLEPEAD